MYFLPLNQPSEAKLALVCFPYAGGHGRIFADWVGAIGTDIALYGVQLPGRGERLLQAPVTEMKQLVRKLVVAFSNMPSMPKVFLGHSLGGRIAFELITQLSSERKELPLHFIASGCRAPHLPRQKYNIHQLPDDEFIAILRQMGGTPKALLEDEELLSLLLPSIKGDFKLAETCPASGVKELPVPISLFNGIDDGIDVRSQSEHWQKHFSSKIDEHWFAGGHFFIHHQQGAYLTELRSVLKKVMAH
ncbi:thioesterase II family protein [Marinomonas mediterranea]|jgi:Predicted thioesterase involved in non-ribosomal peptide biosynthesis|uniref:Thioesterase n=1 Tax=Marinomonas mediterranea (strain ATCC 700492 / JCM 21426 / NBRC 103028 / MMB-1) TaxID=717774 RepID=F2K061_MARM1|nr:thioesterase domain-containing protein [Marinomonas mediterranea]ADZ93275.1 Thioesterase [Marinomonas mediterranea MMB-1]WCN11164.1 thioesterase [Marinomonas mediterranea]WCN15226.1 thioesterase [Marinomonas mediterranea]WCN19272.1 thioesterase [Marinomonas mediterranea MMB-1]